MSISRKESDQKSKVPWSQEIDGFRISGFLSVHNYKSALAYKPRPDDIFIIAYPKCGTHWMQNILGCVFREGAAFSSTLELFSECPFLMVKGAEGVEDMKRPGAIKLHLPFHLTPWSPEAKYIFTARNPKDCCVSFYLHMKKIPAYRFEDGEFDEFFELFINGELEFGDFFDTTLSWWEHRNDPNVLFITYEEMKKDIKMCVLKIAGFIGLEYREKLEKDDKMLDDVIRHSDFDFMKQNTKTYLQKLDKMPDERIRNDPDIPDKMRDILLSDKREVMKNDAKLMRKGVVGDWRNHLSPTQNARMNKKIRERLAGTELLELWKDHMM